MDGAALAQVPGASARRLTRRLLDDLQVVQLHVIAPAGIGVPLFEHRQTFREPPRNFVVGHLQRDDVRELVPERASPVEVIELPRRRRVHHEQVSKADSKSAQAGQSDGADFKVAVIRKHLEGQAGPAA